MSCSPEQRGETQQLAQVGSPEKVRFGEESTKRHGLDSR